LPEKIMISRSENTEKTRDFSKISVKQYYVNQTREKHYEMIA